MSVANVVKKIVRLFGIDIIKYHTLESRFPDYTQNDIKVIRTVKPYTMTSPERIYSLIQAINYVVRYDIPGAIIECGVWKGGSMMAVIQTLLDMGALDRELYLFDTYEGMSQPQDVDVSVHGQNAMKIYEKERNKKDKSPIFCYSPLDEVKSNILSLGYNTKKIHFIKGKVEDTVPENAPDTIALLRLDTDWYESTLHELRHLFPRLSTGGVLIVDDYGYWLGEKKAIDEYLSLNGIPILLNRIDATGRIAIKQ